MYGLPVLFRLCQERYGFEKSRIWMVELLIPFHLWNRREWEMTEMWSCLQEEEITENAHDPSQNPISGPDFQVLSVLVIMDEMLDQKVSHKYPPI